MAVFQLPAGHAPSQEDWSIENDDRSGGTSIVGTEQIVSSGAGRWSAKITFVVYGAEILAFRGPLLALRGRFNQLRIGPRNLAGQPSGVTSDDWAVGLGLTDTTARGSDYATAPAVAASLAASATLGDTSVQITMPRNRVAQVGQYISLAGVALHVITAVDGTACAIEPALRADASAGDPVEFTRPVCLMRARTKLSGLPIPARGPTTITLDLVEALSTSGT